METQLGKSDKVFYIQSAKDAISKGLTFLKSDSDKMAIVGTHHFGKPIIDIFNISFNTL